MIPRLLPGQGCDLRLTLVKAALTKPDQRVLTSKLIFINSSGVKSREQPLASLEIRVIQELTGCLTDEGA